MLTKINMTEWNEELFPFLSRQERVSSFVRRALNDSMYLRFEFKIAEKYKIVEYQLCLE